MRELLIATLCDSPLYVNVVEIFSTSFDIDSEYVSHTLSAYPPDIPRKEELNKLTDRELLDLYGAVCIDLALTLADG